MRFILEAARDRLQQTAALDEGAFMTVDQDVADRRILEQRLQRTETRHLVENFRDEGVELMGVERQPLGHDVLRDELLDVRPHLVFGQLFQRRKVDLLDQLAVQPHLGVEEFVAEQRIIGGRRCLLLRLGRLRRRHQQRALDRNRRGCAAACPRRAGVEAALGRDAGTGARRRLKRLDIALTDLIRTSPVTYFAHDGLSFCSSDGALGASALAALCGSTSLRSCAVILLPGFTSSSGTPRSIASRTN